MADNTQVNDAFGLSGWMVEIPQHVYGLNEPTPPAFRYYDPLTIDSLVKTTGDAGIPYGLAFRLQNSRNFPDEKIDFHLMLTDVSGILLRTEPYPPQYIVFLGLWTENTEGQSLLSGFVESVRTDFPAFKGQIIFGLQAHRIPEHFDWCTPDLIGIVYHSPPNLDFKSHFRRINQVLGKKLAEEGKPAFILQSNLLGDDKVLLFKNQIRFWPHHARVEGIVLNTLYCDLSLKDTATRFALGNDPGFQSYLKHYARKVE
jgi:hypothetical protein